MSTLTMVAPVAPDAPRIDPGPGWAVAIDHIVYDARKDTGKPFGFRDVWLAARGVKGARIYRPDGSLYLADAGDLYVRDCHTDKAWRAASDRCTRSVGAAHVAHSLTFGHPVKPEAVTRYQRHPMFLRVMARYTTPTTPTTEGATTP